MKNIESVKKEQFIYLTTTGRNTGKDHTVELWFAYDNGKLYLSHEGNKTDWMKNISKNRNVKVRIDSLTTKAVGKLLEKDGDPSREVGKKALYEKYYKPAKKEVIDDWFSLSALVELTPVDEKS